MRRINQGIIRYKYNSFPALVLVVRPGMKLTPIVKPETRNPEPETRMDDLLDLQMEMKDKLDKMHPGATPKSNRQKPQT